MREPERDEGDERDEEGFGDDVEVVPTKVR